MSNHEYRDTEEASDARFDTPYTDGEHIGNDHQEADTVADAHQRDVTGLNRNPVGDLFGVGVPAESFRPMRSANTFVPTPAPQGLQWHDGNGKRIDHLADPYWLAHASNIELRTVLAHLMEAATIARQAMRDRSMVVDL